MPTVSIGDLDVYYERRGEGPRLLFLNGSGSTLASSGLLVDAFASAFDVAAHDQRGLGRTGVPPGAYTMADYAADAAGLLNHLEWDTCRVVGVSFGGMVAQELAVTWPDRIEKLALLCTSAGGTAGASYPLHELAHLTAAERAARSLMLVDRRFTSEWLADHPHDRHLVELMAAGRDAAASSEADAEADADAVSTPRSEQRRGEHEQLEIRRHHDVADRLGAISCPTLVAAGRFDGIAPVENSQQIADRIDGADLRLYDGGHLFFIQDRTALPDVLDFLA